jgi:hypothetical protein
MIKTIVKSPDLHFGAVEVVYKIGLNDMVFSFMYQLLLNRTPVEARNEYARFKMGLPSDMELAAKEYFILTVKQLSAADYEYTKQSYLDALTGSPLMALSAKIHGWAVPKFKTEYENIVALYSQMFPDLK